MFQIALLVQTELVSRFGYSRTRGYRRLQVAATAIGHLTGKYLADDVLGRRHTIRQSSSFMCRQQFPGRRERPFCGELVKFLPFGLRILATADG
jgi:hypothetical protein